MRDHEIDGFRRHEIGGKHQIAFIFPVFFIDQYHHAAGAQFSDDLFGAGYRHCSSSYDAWPNLLRVGIGGLRCSPYLRTVARLGHLSLPLATVLPGVVSETKTETSSTNIPRISGNFLITCYFKGFSACRPEIRQLCGTDAAAGPGKRRFPDPAHAAAAKRAPPALQRA